MQYDRRCWPELRSALTTLMASKTRDAWCVLLEGTDACFAPVLTLAEAPAHHHATVRTGYISVDGVVQPAPTPRFSRSAPAEPTPAVKPGAHTDALLAEAGYSADEIHALRAAGAAKGD